MLIRALCLLLIVLPYSPLKAKDPLSLDRIVVIGASVSRGFTESEPFGGEKSKLLRFDRYLDAALRAPHGKIVNDSNHLFFVSPEKESAKQLERLRHRKPTLVIGIDYLFWYLYGYPENTGDRLELFDRGLESLSKIEVPLIIGDIPDASASIGHMLARAMVPDAETRSEANRRLAAWAAKRPQVSVISLSSFLRSCEANAAITVGPLSLKQGSTRELLQADRLHPTPMGCATLALAVFASFDGDDLKPDQIVWNPAEILRLIPVD
ncbi:hypothetical protein ACFQY0_15925 [Haloferula chungangensis]|uniref:SGNH/GDSL hydrolase family protein n=1 Tax=Haloferula chungangensis TaxID=1048331 RepID=A0ABW2L8E9_9BACT